MSELLHSQLWGYSRAEVIDLAKLATISPASYWAILVLWSGPASCRRWCSEGARGSFTDCNRGPVLVALVGQQWFGLECCSASVWGFFCKTLRSHRPIAHVPCNDYLLLLPDLKISRSECPFASATCWFGCFLIRLLGLLSLTCTRGTPLVVLCSVDWSDLVTPFPCAISAIFSGQESRLLLFHERKGYSPVTEDSRAIVLWKQGEIYNTVTAITGS